VGHNFVEGKAAADHDHTDNGQAHGQLIADQLGRGAQAAQQGVLAPGAPPRQHQPIHPHRREGQDIQQADVDIGHLQLHRMSGDLQIRSKGNHREGHKGGNHGDHRRQEVNGSVHVVRDDILLEQELEAVGHRLQETPGAHPVRSQAILDEPRNAPLGQGHSHNRNEDGGKHHHHLD